MKWPAVALLLAGCSSPIANPEQGGAALEAAAIAAGVVRDPADTDITGLYARETDRVCVVPAGRGYRIGASIDYGGGQGCSGAGTLTRSGETLRVEFTRAPGCSFDARLDGERIVFPGRLPAACERLCSERVSFAALEGDLLSDASSEATTLRDGKGKLLCGS
ncbi:MAG: hypothetical protein V4659_10650 [Pseudomonadota bacterium]